MIHFRFAIADLRMLNVDLKEFKVIDRKSKGNF